MAILRIATRGSALALWQAEHIRHVLQQNDPTLTCELLVLKTKGDIWLDVPLAKVGGKGLFVKEIEDALLDGRADLAVHSMKDVPMDLPAGLCLAAVPQREEDADLFLSSKYQSLAALPQNAVLGTSSLRREAQVRIIRPDLTIKMLRGNVGTRLDKLEKGEYDAIILAKAGVKRLGLSAQYTEELTPPRFLPAVGQGALGIEIREDNAPLMERLSALNHKPTRICVEAERAFLRHLNGGCQVPIACKAVLEGHKLLATGLVAKPDATLVLRASLEGTAENPTALGQLLAQNLIHQGAHAILAELTCTA